MNGVAAQQRNYAVSECVVFRKTNETFGGLSNMAPGFPIIINQTRLGTSEALYQCCRFPDAPEVQEMIVAQRSPMTAKMRSKRFRERTRPDWESIKVHVMRWCLQVKLCQNRESFGRVLLSTESKAIVEQSAKDQFWGAKPDGASSHLVGANVLGRLLMQLRDQYRALPEKFRKVEPLHVPDFKLLGEPIGVVSASGSTRSIPSNEPAALEEGLDVLPVRMARISGAVGPSDWDELMHALAVSELSPERALLDFELFFSLRDEDRSFKLDALEQLARRFGIRFQVR